MSLSKPSGNRLKCLDLDHRSNVTGNCFYSSASLVQVGNNSLIESLRVLTSTELFNNAEFYSQHPCFSAVVNEHPECFSKSINMFFPYLFLRSV